MNNKLSNFDKIKKSLLDNFNDNKLHHGLLFSGNKGIGKAAFAIDLATQIILSSCPNQNDDLTKIQSNSHPDLLIIKKDEKKRDITVDAVRDINQFLSLTAAISKHRVIIIDSLDDLNRSSNNAILKTLEEPPANVFLFLINHNQAKVIDTIKSRCRLIKIANPDYADFKEILEKNIEGIEEEEIKILAKISDHSIGSALEMYNYNAVDLYEQIGQLILENNNKAIFDLAKTISANEELWNIFEKLIIFYLYNSLYLSLERHPDESQDPFCRKADPNFRQDDGFGGIDSVGKKFILIDKITNLFSATKNLNLDKSQSIINIFNIIKNSKNEK
jgi:DNA polymerase III gamma/tau subunit